MKAGIVYFTEMGRKTAEVVENALVDLGYACKNKEKKETLQDWCGEMFAQADALVFVSATGIAVRTIAPFLQSKTEDPAVICIDDGGNFVVSLLSGHVGGANLLTERLAKRLGATPVVTTSTDVNGRFAADKWAVENGLLIQNIEVVKEISMALLHDEKVGIRSDLPLVIEDKQLIEKNLPLGIHISWRKAQAFPRELKLIPKRLSLGIGCRRGTPKEKIAAAVRQVLDDYAILEEAIENVASIDLKQDEPGLLAFCEDRGLALLTYSAQELQTARGEFSGSEFVEKITGVSNVCQRAAVLAAGQGKPIVKKTAIDGVTIAIAVKEEILYVK